MLKARKDGLSIKVRYGKAVLVGSSKAGKSSFFRLLMKKSNLKPYISTGVADSHRLKLTKVGYSCSQGQVKFVPLDLDKEIKELYLRLLKIKDSKEDPDPSDTDSQNSEMDIPVPDVLTDIEKNDIVIEAEEEIEENDFQEPWDILTFIDSGGQPQYVNMLPAVNSSAMITFVVINMLKDLNSKVEVFLGTKNGEHTLSPVEYTNLELIKTLMANVNNVFVQKMPPYLEKVCSTKDIRACVKESNSCSYISFIGTRRDLVKDKATISKLETALGSEIQKSGLSRVWEYGGAGKYLIQVDNNLAGPTENDQNAIDVRDKLNDLMKKQHIYDVPIVWVILELEIRRLCLKRNSKYIMLEDIKKLCKDKDLIKDENLIKEGLKFHHLFGVLLYYDEVDGMRNLVITDHQWLLNNLTKIVYHSYFFLIASTTKISVKTLRKEYLMILCWKRLILVSK